MIGMYVKYENLNFFVILFNNFDEALITKVYVL